VQNDGCKPTHLFQCDSHWFVFRKPFFEVDLEGKVNSSLHPLENQLPVIIRWAASPVYSASNTNSSKPDGVLLYGDIVNGKIAYNEMITSEFGDGYAATYRYDNVSETFTLISSIRKGASDLVLDEDIPEAQQVLSAALKTKSATIVSGVSGFFKGDYLEFSAERIEGSIAYQCTGASVPLLDDVYNPHLYQVRATSNAGQKKLQSRQLIIQVVTIVLATLTSCVITLLLFLPIYRFVYALQIENGMRASPRRTGFLNLSCFDCFYTKRPSRSASFNNSRSQIKSTEVTIMSIPESRQKP
jgi:hypothetical protein